MRLVATILALVLLSGCAAPMARPMPVADEEGWVRLPLAWKEVKDTHNECRKFLNETGKSYNVADGCSGWRNGEFRIITRIVTEESHFCTVGHEVGHGKNGRFHRADGTWIINTTKKE